MNKIEYKFCLKWAKKIKAINILGGKCKKCCNNDMFVLQFHHLQGKSEDVTCMIKQGRRWGDILKELKLCELMCANCHKEYHCKMGRKAQKRAALLPSVAKCINCEYGGENLASLEFHHRENVVKKFKINDASCNKIKVSVLDLEEELSKCDILCSNCHQKEHIDIKKFNKHKSYIYKLAKVHKEKNKNVDKKIVKKMLKNGYKQIEIARELDCAKSTISRIVKLYC